MKHWPIFFLFAAAPAQLMASERSACGGYYYFADGRRIESIVVDDRARPKNRKLATISAVTASRGAVSSTITTETYDARGKLLDRARSEARCENGDLLLDLTAGLPIQKERLRQQSAVLLRYPASMQVGRMLDARVDFDLEGAAKGKAMKVNFSMANRRVAGRLAVETPLGRREAFRITSILNVSFRVAGIAIPMRFDLTEYFVPGLGVVGSEASQKGRAVERSTIRFLPRR